MHGGGGVPPDQIDPGVPFGNFSGVRTPQIIRTAKGWRDDSNEGVAVRSAGVPATLAAAQRAKRRRRLDAICHGAVTIRDVSRRQIFVGDDPVGGVIDAANPALASGDAEH